MLLKHDIRELEAIIGAVVSLSGKTAGDYSEWESKALAAVREWDRKVHANYLNVRKDEPLRRQLHFYQAMLTHQSDRLFTNIFIQNKSSAIKTALDAIEEVLKGQKLTYGGFFDVNQPVSLYSLRAYQTAFRSQFQSLYDALPKEDADTRTLMDEIRGALEQLTAADHGNRPNYEDLKHAAYFLQILTDSAVSKDASSVFYRLMTDNFNASAVISWYQKRLLDAWSVLNENDQRIRIEMEERKWLSVAVSSRPPLNPHQPSGPEQLLTWLAKLKHQKGFDLDIAGTPYRLPLSLSVAQFGLFLRLCYLTGCFHEQNISEILRFFARHFTSKKQEHVSQKSLAKAFYSAEFSTAVSGRAWLQRMVDHLKKKYFPK